MQAVMAHHVKNCPSCQEDEKVLRGLYQFDWDAAFPEVEAPSFFADKVMARIEREQVAGPWWQRLLTQVPNFGRTTIGIGLASAAAVALVWSVNYRPGMSPSAPIQPANLLPAADMWLALNNSLPRLRISESHDLSEGRFYAFRFEVLNADSASIRVSIPGAEKPAYPFVARQGHMTQPLIVPVSLVGQEKTLPLTIDWEVEGKTHTRAIVVPTPDAANVADERLTLDEPEMGLADAVRRMAGDYGSAVAMDDIPLMQKVHLTANNETFAEALQRNLAPLGMKVSASAAGVAIQRADAPQSANPAGATPTLASHSLSSAEVRPAP